MFYIGMIEDDMAEASSAMLSLNENSDQIEEQSFKIYPLMKKENFKKELFEKITEDIKDNRIQGLIVDYKLDTMDEVLEGIEVVNFVHELVPEFPVIILTNVPDTSKKNDKVDPDKVYTKEVFLNNEKEETRDMVYNIVRNLERYVKKRVELETRREQLLNCVVDNAQENETYGELLETEKELNKYTPIGMTEIDNTYKVDDMKEALELLKEYKGLLE